MSSPSDKPVRYGLDECLNCGTPLGSERYCPNCGQLNTDRIVSIWTLVGDFLRDYFSFDSKFFRTTVPLMIRPGKVPREFFEGRRVRHIPPLRMLIFSSFVMFLVWGWTYDPEESIFGYVGQEFSSGFSEGLELAAADSVPGIDTLAVLDGGARITAESDFTQRLARMDSLTKSGVPLDDALEEVKEEGEELQTVVLRQIQRLRMSDNATVIKYFIGNLSFAILLIQPVFAFILYLMYWRRRYDL